MSKVKVIAMDLDGTLTQHKQKLNAENKKALDALRERYCLLMVGAGQVKRIFNQLDKYPIDIIGNYGLQYGKYNKETGEIDILRDLNFEIKKKDVDRKAAVLREKYGYTDYAGESLEFHPSGCVTFALLGTEAKSEDKLSFDPDRVKRRNIYKEVTEVFSDYNVFIGGSSSFDMAPKPYDKYYALDLYCRENGISHAEVIYIGDDGGQGGNDEAVFLSDFNSLSIDNYMDFPEIIKKLLE